MDEKCHKRTFIVFASWKRKIPHFNSNYQSVRRKPFFFKPFWKQKIRNLFMRYNKMWLRKQVGQLRNAIVIVTVNSVDNPASLVPFLKALVFFNLGSAFFFSFSCQYCPFSLHLDSCQARLHQQPSLQGNKANLNMTLILEWLSALTGVRQRVEQFKPTFRATSSHITKENHKDVAICWCALKDIWNGTVL